MYLRGNFHPFALFLSQVLTFLLDVRRFRYPERPVVFLSVCYFMVALAYVIGYAMGDSVSCNPRFDPPPDFPAAKEDMINTITQVKYNAGRIKTLSSLELMANFFPIFHFLFTLGYQEGVVHYSLHAALLL